MWRSSPAAGRLMRLVMLTVLVTGCVPVRDADTPEAVGTPGLEVDAAAPDNPPPAACQTAIQALVDAAPPGAVVTTPPCLARETLIIRRPITLDGRGEAEIRGSDVWTDWDPDGSGWVSSARVPPLERQAGQIECVADRCQWPEQVFVDSRALEQVAQGVRPETGQFSLDDQRRVLLGEDPRGRLVEVTLRARWIDVQSDGVTIQGFTMRHAASPAQHGGIGNQDRSSFTLQDSVLTDAHGAVVSIGGGRDVRVLRNDISRGGQEGINGYRNVDTLIRGNRIHGNNTEGFKPEWEGGGVKLVAFTNATLDANEVYANYGPGLWCDIGCHSVTFSDNRVHGNAGAGIFFEISEGAQIVRNTVWGTPTSTWPAILVSSSADTEVRDNVVAWSPVGIAVQSAERNDRPVAAGSGNSVDGNTILVGRRGALAIEWAEYGSGDMFEPGSRNAGANNSYWFPFNEDGQARFAWRGRLPTVARFNATPGGRNGRYLSTSERDAVLERNGIPQLR